MVYRAVELDCRATKALVARTGARCANKEIGDVRVGTRTCRAGRASEDRQGPWPFHLRSAVTAAVEEFAAEQSRVPVCDGNECGDGDGGELSAKVSEKVPRPGNYTLRLSSSISFLTKRLANKPTAFWNLMVLATTATSKIKRQNTASNIMKKVQLPASDWEVRTTEEIHVARTP